MKSKISHLLMSILVIYGFLAGNTFPGLEKGTIVKKVPTLVDPDQSYALYLPSGYDRGRQWPLLVCFDPGARSEIPLILFQKAAEKYGYIVVCSNNLKNGPWQPVVDAMKAMWSDILNRFSIDFNRVYAAGFSGGARASAAFPHIIGQQVAGIISCGAGLPPALKAEQVKPAYYHGIVGIRDFNYKEMVRLNRELESAGVDHFIQVFIGDHSWPPEEICLQALQFMEVRAMKEGLKPKNQDIIEQIYRNNLDQIREKERVLNPYYALIFSRSLLDHFQGLVDTALIKTEILRLEASREFKKFHREEEKRNHNELEYIRRFLSVFNRIKNYEQKRIDLKRIEADLDLKRLVRESSGDKDRFRSAMAKRLLDELVSKGNQEGADYLSKKDYIRAEIFLRISSRAFEKGIRSYYNLARIHALQNNTKEAIKFLTIMVDNGRSRGVNDFSFLLEQEDLKSLRNLPEFMEIIKKAGLKKSD